jgi:manganese oxidase
MMRPTASLMLVTLALFVARFATPLSPEHVTANDNRQVAGTLAGGVLTVALEARHGVWRPEGDSGRALDAAAFAEVGHPLSTPGPLIRVHAGTEVHTTIHNALEMPLVVFGFGAHGASDSITIAAGGTSDVRFTPNVAGTFYYVGRRAASSPGPRAREDMQLNGVIVVDPAGAHVDPAERVLAITWSSEVDPASKTGIGRTTMAINGRSWPHTERLTYEQGDSVHWRVVNFTELDHPMHLHGFYFRLDANGDGVTDSLFAGDRRRMEVTQVLQPFHTMMLAWRADRAGNWVYHCHYSAHISSLVSLDAEGGDLDSAMLSHHMSDRPHQMFGLVMGITVEPRGVPAKAPGDERKLRLLVREKSNVYGEQTGYSFVLGGSPDETMPEAMPVPGAPIILERGKPVAITVVNQSNDHAAVHWHGIELESYPDGVPGWSGSLPNVMQPIKPRDSLTVRFTPPRAGTFMYHSHFNENQQMGGGLYGPIIVLEPGQRFDPVTDKVLFFGTAGITKNVVFGPFASFLMNGQRQPEPMTLHVGTTYRFRLLNLAGDEPLFIALRSGATAAAPPVDWRAVAKDGYPLPASQATSRPATLLFDPGEIYDFEYTPRTPGELAFVFGPEPPQPGAPPSLPGTSPPAPTITVPVHVR